MPVYTDLQNDEYPLIITGSGMAHQTMVVPVTIKFTLFNKNINIYFRLKD